MATLNYRMNTPFSVGGTMRYVNQSKNYIVTCGIWLLRKRGKFCTCVVLCSSVVIGFVLCVKTMTPLLNVTDGSQKATKGRCNDAMSTLSPGLKQEEWHHLLSGPWCATLSWCGQKLFFWVAKIICVASFCGTCFVNSFKWLWKKTKQQPKKNLKHGSISR